MKTLWEQRYAKRTEIMQSSAIRELLKLTEQPDVISFAGGLPASEVFPTEKFKQACQIVLDEHGARSLQYSTTEGCAQLRRWISEKMDNEGVKVSYENILITTGSQQALDLIGKIFINPGDKICVESPTYLGALQAWNAYEAQYIPVPIDDDGMIPDELEKALRAGPKFIYVLPNFQNPSGVSLSLERRLELVKLADQYGVPIVEDDPYGQLRFEGDRIDSIVHIDSAFRDDCCIEYRGNVIYLSTFSKILAPGLRLAWVVAPPDVIKKLVQAKQGTDLHTSTFNQLVAYEIAKNGYLDELIITIRAVYKERRDVMIDSIQKYFPENVGYTTPLGGLFLWGYFPIGFSTYDLLDEALKQNVAFVPGSPFYPLGGGENTMRLNFSNANPAKIKMGIERLGNAIKEMHAFYGAVV